MAVFASQETDTPRFMDSPVDLLQHQAMVTSDLRHGLQGWRIVKISQIGMVHGDDFLCGVDLAVYMIDTFNIAD